MEKYVNLQIKELLNKKYNGVHYTSVTPGKIIAIVRKIQTVVDFRYNSVKAPGTSITFL